MWKVVVVAAGVALAATAINAATVTATYTGTVEGSLDENGVFGAPGGNVNGASFTATLIYDTSIGRSTGPNSDSLGGGAGGLPSPLISAGLVIDGTLLSFSGTNGTEVSLDFGSSTCGHRVSDDSVAGSLTTSQNLNFRVLDPAFPSNLDLAYSGDPGPFGATPSQFNYSIFDSDTGFFLQTFGVFDVSNLTIAVDDGPVDPPPSPIPLPASGLLLAGALGVVASGRRLRRGTEQDGLQSAILRGQSKVAG